MDNETEEDQRRLQDYLDRLRNVTSSRMNTEWGQEEIERLQKVVFALEVGPIPRDRSAEIDKLIEVARSLRGEEFDNLLFRLQDDHA